MSQHYDSLETRSLGQREKDQLKAVVSQIQNAKDNAPAFSQILESTDAASITSREALAELPVTRKSEMISRQEESKPFGGLATVKSPDLAYIFSSPGPIYEPSSKRADYWRFARALYAAGFRQGDIIHNSFSYHFTPAGSMLDTGAHALGCAVIPAGVGQTETQVQTIVDVKPQGYVGTPSFLQIIIDKAKEMKADISSINRAVVSGEALPPSLRKNFQDQGIAVVQCYATADLGMIAYESPGEDGLIIDEGVLVEIVRPGTGDPVAEGEVGEVVVTTLNPDYPLIRFATGDLSAILSGTSGCGRTNQRIKGWMGRADQTTKVRGMFVHPEQVDKVIKRHSEIIKGRLVVDRKENSDVMVLKCESETNLTDDIADSISKSIREICKLRGGVAFVDSNSLPNDGKVIDDIRIYE